MAKKKPAIAIPKEVLISKIYELRGEKVMLDSELAELYEVETKVLKQAVRRNIDIFPEHFMFELTKDELESLKSQTVTSNIGRGGARYLPMVFTEHGILQVANVLRSDRAKHMSVHIIEVFVKMRELILTHQDIFKQLEEIRATAKGQDDQLQMIFAYLKQFEEVK